MTSNSIIQLQLALQVKEQLISQNADLLFDKLIVKVCHSIETTPAYTFGLTNRNCQYYKEKAIPSRTNQWRSSYMLARKGIIELTL